MQRPKNSLSLGNIVLAAHSGGGHLQGQMAQNFGGAFNKINEVWCFDSLYWGSEPFLNWLKKGHSRPRLFIHTTSGTTAGNAKDILDVVPTILGIPPLSPPAKPKPARTPLAKLEAKIAGALEPFEEALHTLGRALLIATKTTKIDILIESVPKIGKPAATDFFLSSFGGIAGGHYEGIEMYLPKLVDTSRNLA
jgi:hypothetical protein